VHSLSTPSCDPFRGSSTAQSTRSAHGLATFTKLKSSSWRVQVRRKRKYVNETFLRRKDAEEWASRLNGGPIALVRGSRETKTLGESRGPTRRTIRGERAGTTNAFRPRSPRAGSNGLRIRHSASVRSPRDRGERGGSSHRLAHAVVIASPLLTKRIFQCHSRI
jgi:hypothetical protein